MNHRIRRPLLTLGLLNVALLSLGGCPLDTLPGQDAPLLPEPGSYWVESQDDALFYFQLAETRDKDNEWVELNDDGLWYDGPGFYLLSEDGIWMPDEDAAGLTLDELVQLHDPPPAPPSAD